jgi:hypothetical protein|tara:strand:+ start:605 stop:1228 length:624 start_codon:yes stop_codon:yes gene_type:complete
MSIVTLNDRAVRSVTTFGSIHTGSMVFIKKLTASSSATLSFVNGSSDVVFDSTYKEYLFTFKDIHPQFDNVNFLFNGSDDDSSHSYDVTKTTTFFDARHSEAGSDADLTYRTANDLAQSTDFQMLSPNVGAGAADECTAGYLHIFNPSSTTLIKHFVSRFNVYHASNYSMDYHMAGFFNTTADITAVQFKFNTGNTDSGDISLYGIV